MRAAVANSNLILENQKSKCKIKEVIAAKRQFLNFDFLFLIFAFPIPALLAPLEGDSEGSAVAQWNILLTGLVRKNISVFNAGAWFSHHIGHGVTPFLIMRRFLVLSGIIRCTIDLNQHKTRGVILLLDDIKSGDTWLLYAITSILQGGRAEGLGLLRLNMGENMHY